MVLFAFFRIRESRPTLFNLQPPGKPESRSMLVIIACLDKVEYVNLGSGRSTKELHSPGIARAYSRQSLYRNWNISVQESSTITPSSAHASKPLLLKSNQGDIVTLPVENVRRLTIGSDLVVY